MVTTAIRKIMKNCMIAVVDIGYMVFLLLFSIQDEYIEK